MDTLSKTNELLRRYGLNAKKSFGQNFLVDDSILQKIVEAGEVSSVDTVIEIGPGLGNLTQYLLSKGCRVIAFEIDKDMVNILNERFLDNENLKIINDDIMNIDLTKYVTGKVKVIANLPYYITTPILFKLLEYKKNISSIVIMVQKEVASRLLAEPKSKDYGVLTVNTNYVSEITHIIDVPNTSFVPAPSVTSSVVKLKIDLTKQEMLQDEALFKKLVKSAFGARRKKVINSIINAKTFSFDKEQLIEFIGKLGFDQNVRAEEISVEKYIELSNLIKNYNG